MVQIYTRVALCAQELKCWSILVMMCHGTHIYITTYTIYNIYMHHIKQMLYVITWWNVMVQIHTCVVLCAQTLECVLIHAIMCHGTHLCVPWHIITFHIITYVYHDTLYTLSHMCTMTHYHINVIMCHDNVSWYTSIYIMVQMYKCVALCAQKLECVLIRVMMCHGICVMI